MDAESEAGPAIAKYTAPILDANTDTFAVTRYGTLVPT